MIFHPLYKICGGLWRKYIEKKRRCHDRTLIKPNDLRQSQQTILKPGQFRRGQRASGKKRQAAKETESGRRYRYYFASRICVKSWSGKFWESYKTWCVSTNPHFTHTLWSFCGAFHEKRPFPPENVFPSHKPTISLQSDRLRATQQTVLVLSGGFHTLYKICSGSFRSTVGNFRESYKMCLYVSTNFTFHTCFEAFAELFSKSDRLSLIKKTVLIIMWPAIPIIQNFQRQNNKDQSPTKNKQ